MPTQAEPPAPDQPSENPNRFSTFVKRFLGRSNHPTESTGTSQEPQALEPETSPTGGILRRASRRVVPGLPRAKTFKRQQSELREKLETTKPTQAERRAVSVDRRGHHPLRNVSSNISQHPPRASAPELSENVHTIAIDNSFPVVQTAVKENQFLDVSDVRTLNVDPTPEDGLSLTKFPSRETSAVDARSITTSNYDDQIHDELERKWILNLSMHFRDKSKREKFFVTYREKEFLWRRVTISLDYRNAPSESLEGELSDTKFQREKNAKIYEAIRESLQDIQFYETVTNLKLQTTEGRLHVHVVEDVNEIVHFPSVRMVQHLRCRHIREKDIVFDSHMSGFVYKVRVGGQTLIKKEIPGPDTVEEFLYEVNALNSLRLSSNTIAFHGVVVDDEDQSVKGLLIDYAEKGALIDIIYDAQEHGLDLPWSTREKWAQQIVQGLSDIHEAGFVQGDFTLSNIVIDRDDNAKIIDINRRGCPVGWEPPEATPLIESNQRISMYIGVKSDLYQLGMVLWALAMLEDEPEHHRRPLHLDPEIEVPKWYRRMVENCLNHNPRIRLQATALLAMFPDPSYDDYGEHDLPSISVDDGRSVKQYTVEGFGHRGLPVIRTVTPQSDTYFPKVGYQSELSSPGLSDDAYYYPPRGRSPPSPLPSNLDDCDAGYLERNVTWSEHQTAPSVSDVGPDESQARTPRYTGSAEVHEITKQLEGALNSIETKPNEFYGGRDSAYEEVHVTELETSDGAVATHKIVIEEADAVPRPEISYKDTIAEDLTPTGINIESGAWHLIKSSGGHEASATKEDEPQQAATHGGSNDSNTAQEPTTRKSPLLLQSCNLTDEDDALDSEHLRHGKDAAYTPAFEVADSYEPQSRPIHGPVSNAANDLTGIGSGHNTQDDFRNPICSDEDLGIIGATSRNVASQA